jgi:thymidine kinase
MNQNVNRKLQFGEMASNSPNISSPNISSLSIAIGPMFSGKTTWLLEKYYSQKNRGKKCYPINYIEDKRYSDTQMVTHCGMKIDCFQTKDICSLINSPDVLKNHDVFLINEAQFFADLVEGVKILLDNGKNVYVCGLDGDFKQEKFGFIINLIPICDKVTKLHARCHFCNGRGIFTRRITKETEQKIIGTHNYIAVCRQCGDKLL